MIKLNNHQQKLLLLCALLLGCVLTSVGVEYFARPRSEGVPPASLVQPAVTASKDLGQAAAKGLPAKSMVQDEAAEKVSSSQSFTQQSFERNIAVSKTVDGSSAEQTADITVKQERRVRKGKGEQTVTKQRQQKQAAAQELVNINTATEAELDSLPGIGPATAKKIIAQREQAPFATIEDIMLVKGIGKVKFAKLRERITVE